MPFKETSRYIPLKDQLASMRRQVVATALQIFSGWGYREIEVPLIDDFDILKKGLGPEQIEESIRFLDRAGNVMILRSDSTPMIAKALSPHLEKSKVVQRVCYANKVVRIAKRRTKYQLGSYQVGVELVGVEGIAAEVELICICVELLRQLELDLFQLYLTDHALVSRILVLTGAPNRIRNEVRVAIQARDLFSVREILGRVGVREKYICAVEAIADIQGGMAPLDVIDDLLGSDSMVAMASVRLRRLMEVLDALGFAELVSLDLGGIHSQDYYDGLAFHIVSEGVGRHIGAGGRYDHLFGSFGRRDVPAVGFALETNLLCELIYQKQKMGAMLPDYTLPERVTINDSNMIEGFKEMLNYRKNQQQARIVITKNP